MKEYAGLYIHIPFCAAKCAYCDFCSIPVSTDKVNAYTAALSADIKAQAARFRDMRFDTMFIGGGTPSVLGERLFGIVSDALDAFSFVQGSEISTEVNPDSVSPPLLRGLKSAGINRISVGLQSLDDSTLRRIGRIHDSATGLRAVDEIQKAGFDNFNTDIMFGLPDGDGISSYDALYRTVTQLSHYAPPHISAYSLTLSPDTPMGRNRDSYSFPDEDGEDAQYNLICDTFGKAGYLHYEISNFARRGFECRHNLKYWRGCNYVGIGCAAHSCVDGIRRRCPPDIDAYCRGNTSSETLETVDERAAAFERLMLGLRTCEGVNYNELSAFFDIEGLKREVSKLEDAGLAVAKEGYCALTERGYRVSNQIILSLERYMNKDVE